MVCCLQNKACSSSGVGVGFSALADVTDGCGHVEGEQKGGDRVDVHSNGSYAAERLDYIVEKMVMRVFLVSVSRQPSAALVRCEMRCCGCKRPVDVSDWEHRILRASLDAA